MSKRRARRLGLAIVAVLATAAASLWAVGSASASQWPLTKSGSQGSTVETAQYLLRQAGQDIEADGSFGPATEAAVKAVQKAEGLDADGLIGEKTWPALTVDLDADSSGEAVKGAQVQLKRMGFDVPVDGKYTGATTDAVVEFKKEHDLPADVTVDEDTWRELITGQAKVGAYVLPLPQDAAPREYYTKPHHDYAAADIPAPKGTPVYALINADAVVFSDSSCGNGVQLTAPDGAVYVYCHMNKHTIGSGAVNAGDQVGVVGSTGHSTGPHLHVQIKVDGTKHCPQNLLAAIYDGDEPPAPATLPTSGCSN